MAEDKRIRLARKKAIPMEELVGIYIKEMKIASGLNSKRVFAAWDQVSGMGPYTLRKFFRGGKLFLTMSSSMVRSQLWLQREALVKMMNDALAQDPLFTDDGSGPDFVKELILK